ncbi:hypothetical protein, partial [Aeromonas salmonicida]|uniref:hypothetical protein n=1 Tax=Aeromonas salmonicida TaxID=645 RepID=UPI001C65975E
AAAPVLWAAAGGRAPELGRQQGDHGRGLRRPRCPGRQPVAGPAQLNGIATQGNVVLVGLLPVHILVRCIPVSQS